MNYILTILHHGFNVFDGVRDPDEFLTRAFCLLLLIPILSISYYFILKGIGYLFTYNHRNHRVIEISKENAKNKRGNDEIY